METKSVVLDRFNLNCQLCFRRKTRYAVAHAKISAIEGCGGIGAAHFTLEHGVLNASELADLQLNRLGHTMQSQFAIHSNRLVAVEFNRSAFVGGGREFLHVEYFSRLDVFVQFGMTEVDRRCVDDDIHGTGFGSTIQCHSTAGLGEFATPDRDTHVIGFKAWIGVAWIDGVRVGSQSGGRRSTGGEQGNQGEFQFHGTVLCNDRLSVKTSWFYCELRCCYDVKLDGDFIGDHACIFPFTFTDVECEALDRHGAVKNLSVAFFLHGQGETHVSSFALDGQLARDVIFGAGRCAGGSLDGAGNETGLGKLCCVKPFLLYYFLVVFSVTQVETGNVDVHAGFGCVGFGTVEIDLCGEFLEFGLNRDVQLLEHGTDGAFACVNLERCGNRGRNQAKGGDAAEESAGQCGTQDHEISSKKIIRAGYV